MSAVIRRRVNLRGNYDAIDFADRPWRVEPEWIRPSGRVTDWRAIRCDWRGEPERYSFRAPTLRICEEMLNDRAWLLKGLPQ